MAKLAVWGNETTMNLESILQNNILSCHYFKDLYRLKTYHEVIHEIVSEVRTLEPWISKNPKTPSTAFCLMYKFFTMKLTEKQMVGLIDHPDNQFVRGIGFLYLRYSCPPKDLWSWFGPYLEEESEISPKGAKGSPQTFGSFLVGLLTELKYFDTLLPRIPIPVQKELDQELSKLKLPKKNNQREGNNNNYRERDNQRDRREERKRSRSPQRRSSSSSPSRRDNYRDSRDSRDNRDRSRGDRRDDRDREYRKDDRRGRDHRDDRRENNRDSHRDNRRDDRDRDYRSNRDRDDRDQREEKRRRRSNSRSPERKREESPKKEEEKEEPKMARADMSMLKAMYGAHTSANLNEDNTTMSSGYEKETLRIGGRR